MDNQPTTQPGHHHGYRLFPALWVIGLGAVFLMQNLDIHLPFVDIANWWAWVILVGALAPLEHAWRLYRDRGSVDGAVIHHLFAAAAIVAVAGMFILDLSWGLWWPLFMIFGGLSMLFRGRRDANEIAR